MSVFIFHLGICVLAAFDVDALIAHAQSIWVKRRPWRPSSSVYGVD
jgi:hypothetical protein